jgi:thiamine transport system permease protein
LAQVQQAQHQRRKKILDFVSRRWSVRTWYGIVLVFFIFFVLIPTLFVLSFLFTGWGNLQAFVFSNSGVLAQIWSALELSFGVALTVTVVDLLFGLPLAWFIVRREFRGKALLNTLVDLPLAVPTAGLGFSTALFWSLNPAVAPPPLSLNITNTPFLLVMLLHFTTTFPYMVRSLAAILEQIDIEYEIAARTLGAPPLTAARTVTLPLFRSGLATGAILCLAKALSDTGGVQAALQTANLFAIHSNTCNFTGTPSGTVLIGAWRTLGKACPTIANQLNAGLAFVAILMIVLSIGLLYAVKLTATRAGLPIKKVWPGREKKLSRGTPTKGRDLASFVFLVFLILVPSFFLTGYLISGSRSLGNPDWNTFSASLVFSFIVAGSATAIDLAFGVPLALFITRAAPRKVSSILDSLVNIPYIVPSAALGFSLFLFWKPLIDSGAIPVLAVIILAHVGITIPFVIRNAVGALEEMDPGLDETSKTLGAKPLQSFRRVTFPVIKPAILAGSIMAFTRSVGETGATQAVSPQAVTAPVYIVSLLNTKTGNFYLAALSITILTIISAGAMLGMRYTVKRAR